MIKKEKEKIDYIMESFNFKSVHRTMKILNWKWAMGDGKERVPSLSEIKSEVRRMLEDAVRGCPYSTCGFETKYDNGLLTLKFCIEEWYA